MWTDVSQMTLNWGLTTAASKAPQRSFTFNSITPYTLMVYAGESQPADTPAGECRMCVAIANK